MESHWTSQVVRMIATGLLDEKIEQYGIVMFIVLVYS
jgi:hypothetical protein